MPEILRSRRGRGQASTERRKCVVCGIEANVKGIASHERACKKKKDDLEKTIKFLASQRRNIEDEDLENAIAHTQIALNGLTLEDNPDDDTARGGDMPDIEDHDNIPHTDNPVDDPPINPPANQPSASTERIPHPVDPKTGKLINDAIKIVYHPNSKRAEEVMSLFDYRSKMKATQPVESEPWKPFETRGDYEFAEVSLAANLTPQQNNALISLIHRFILGEAQFTIKSNSELQEKWRQASTKLTDFDNKGFDVSYQKEPRTFRVYYRPIWDWILDLLRDPRIVSQFVWDARKMYKYQAKTGTFVRYVDEPWTADRFWEVQSEFCYEETKSLSIIFYADKNKLSSFGTQKGYPVIVRCANLPVGLRNSDGIGGGIVVGWLPVIPENAQDSGKTGFANFKTKVWHRAVEIILRSIRSASKTGRWVECGDGITRHVCPNIIIISADHEEQWVIGLNRGPKGKKACVVCNHPTAELSNLLVTRPLRTTVDSKAYYELTRSFSTQKFKEFVLKIHGMRPVRSAFWRLGHTDVHHAISWDRLHAYHSGLFAAHIWPVFKAYFKDIGRSAQAKVDNRLKAFPRWKDLYHFESAITVTFNDGSKHEALSKQLLYVIHDIFESNVASEGYLFVRLFRKYLELDVLMSFDVHTEETISSAEAGLKEFGKLLLEYTALTKSDKNWSFLKAHSHKHACEDIRAKGVTRNFNTKPNEKMHGPLRDIYHDRTNFRDVAPQILKVSHHNLISTYIRSQLDVIDNKTDEYDEQELEGNQPPPPPSVSRKPLLPRNDKFVLGAPQKACTFADLEQEKKDDIAFNDFRKKFIIRLNNFFRVYGIPFPDDKYLKLKAQDEIVEFRFLKVYYESLITWEVNTDYLRCTSKFFGKPRYDCVLFNAGPKKCFARLLFMFAAWVKDTAYPFALVQALDAYIGPPKAKDRELGLQRVGLKSRSAVEFIPIISIIRGAVVVPVFEDGKENEFFVMDLIDADMFMRCKDLDSSP